MRRYRLISIHAPARGATLHVWGNLVFTQNIAYLQGFSQFQSTLPQGERQIRYSNDVVLQVFQSTLPQGERHVGRDTGSG